MVVRINGQAVPIAGSLLVHEGRLAERDAELELEHPGGGRVAHVDAALTITLHGAQEFEAMTCRECGLEFDAEQLADQVKAYLEARYGGRRLGDELRDELTEALSPWWDRFRAGADLCFDCGVTPPSP